MRSEDDDAHDDGIILLNGGGEGDAPQAGPGENGLDDDGAGPNTGDDGAEERGDRNHGVAHGVAEIDDLRRQSLWRARCGCNPGSALPSVEART